MKLTLPIPRIELLLKRRELLKLDKTKPSMAIECKQGVIWVTSSGDHDDHMLSAGERYTSGYNSKVVIEAINDACVDIEEPA